MGIWCYQNESGGWRGLALLLTLAVSTAALIRAWRPTAPATVRWDGAAWFLDGPWPLHEARAAVALDLQARLLVHLRDGRRGQWLWLERAAGPERWNDLRRAVYCRPPPAAESLPSVPAA
jgi:toxin CptA